MGRPRRQDLNGEPHCYFVHAGFALNEPLLEIDGECDCFLELLERLRRCFELRIYGYMISKCGYYILLQHPPDRVESDLDLQRRWQELIQSAKSIPGKNLRERFCTLPGIMQTLAQRYSREFHQRQGGRGSIWADRYRSCLLADDTAVLAALTWIHAQPDTQLAAAPLGSSHKHPLLTASPLREVAQGVLVATDEAPLGTLPPNASTWPQLLEQFFDGLQDNPDHYTRALTRGWALGRPESLVPSLSRMSRSSGRGRSRQLHELNDELGLCGIWG